MPPSQSIEPGIITRIGRGLRNAIDVWFGRTFRSR